MLRSDVVAPVVALLFGFVLGAGAQHAVAAFIESADATTAFSSDTLAPPSNPTVANAGCVLLKPSAQVSWTATPSTWADGYDVGRSLTAGGPYTSVATVSGQSTTSYTDEGLSMATKYYYVVRATKAGWRSQPTSEVSLTTGVC